MSVSRLGCVLFVTHLDIVAGSFPNFSDSHLLFKSRSARTTFILLSFAIINPFLDTKLQQNEVIIVWLEQKDSVCSYLLFFLSKNDAKSCILCIFVCILKT